MPFLLAAADFLAVAKGTAVSAAMMVSVPDLLRIEKLQVGCLLDGVPLPGAWVIVHLGTVAKNPFASLHGPADVHGVVKVTGRELYEWATVQANFALMDYVSPDGGLSGELVVAPVGVEDIELALDAHTKMSGFITYPTDFDKDLASLRDRLREAPPGRLTVRVLSIEPQGEFAVTARPGRPSR